MPQASAAQSYGGSHLDLGRCMKSQADESKGHTKQKEIRGKRYGPLAIETKIGVGHMARMTSASTWVSNCSSLLEVRRRHSTILAAQVPNTTSDTKGVAEKRGSLEGHILQISFDPSSCPDDHSQWPAGGSFGSNCSQDDENDIVCTRHPRKR